MTLRFISFFERKLQDSYKGIASIFNKVEISVNYIKKHSLTPFMHENLSQLFDASFHAFRVMRDDRTGAMCIPTGNPIGGFDMSLVEIARTVAGHPTRFNCADLNTGDGYFLDTVQSPSISAHLKPFDARDQFQSNRLMA